MTTVLVVVLSGYSNVTVTGEIEDLARLFEAEHRLAVAVARLEPRGERDLRQAVAVHPLLEEPAEVDARLRLDGAAEVVGAGLLRTARCCSSGAARAKNASSPTSRRSMWSTIAPLS